jgi:hypothetical protein
MKQLLSFITSLGKLKKDQSKSENDMSNTEQLERTRVFQWIKGDSFGKVVTLKSEDNEFLYFTDGSQIYRSVMGEFLMESEDGDEPLPGINDTKKAPRALKTRNIEKIGGGNFPNADANSPQISQQISQKDPIESPLHSLITKLSQKNTETVNLNLEINLPKKEVFTILLENSDEGREELIKEITQAAISRIKIDTLQEYIKGQLNTYINNYYNG